MKQLVLRRQCLQLGLSAFGSLVLAALNGNAHGATSGRRVGSPRQHVARAKRVIFLFMRGGPSQHDMFDYKPELVKRNGQVGRHEGKPLIGPRWRFSRHGQGGQWFSELVPKMAKQADKICMVRSMQTDSSAHPLAIPLLHTGSFQFTRPSLGAWILHGLGTENEDFPGFITINPTRTFGGPGNYGNAFLPSSSQATRIGWEGKSLQDVPINNMASNGSEIVMRRQVELTQLLNRSLLNRGQALHAVAGAIDSMELSVRMERTVPALMDLSGEAASTLAMYGVDGKETDNFSRQCLLARRFAEAGIRFIQLTHGGWDHHSNLPNLATKCKQIDQPIAALLADLEQRGLLDDTLVFWTGEFGRQPDTQILDGKLADGRDHNAKGYCAWLAGGGIRSGMAHGETDELGYEAIHDNVHLYDLHATILHLLGLDHTKLTYHYSGRDFRLTDVHGKVVREIIA